MTDSIILNNTVNSVSAVEVINSITVVSPGPQGPAGTFNAGTIPTIYPITNTSGSIGLSSSYTQASATYSSSANYAVSSGSTAFSSSATNAGYATNSGSSTYSSSTGFILGSNVLGLVASATYSSSTTYANNSGSLGGILSSNYALQSYANSASLNAYNQASAFSTTTSNSASLNAYNNASAFAVTQSNSASLNAYNNASAYALSAANSASLTAYNNASAFAVTQSNSASLNSYNLGITYANSASLNAYNLGVSYSNSASSNAYNSASTYANSASSNAYNLGITYSNSASLNSYNNASAFSVTQSNSASLNAYNNASAFAVTAANSASLTAYNAASAYALSAANSASLTAYNQASAFAVTAANSASLTAYNAASAYALSAANSASLTAYNAASAYTATGSHNNTSASVGYAATAGNSSSTSQTYFSSATFGTTSNAGVTASGQIYTGVSTPLANFAGTASAQLSVIPSSSVSNIGLIIRKNGSSTSNLLEIQDSAGTSYVTVNSTHGLSANATFSTRASSGASDAITIGTTTGYYGDLLRLNNSAATKVGGINQTGQIWTGSTQPLLLNQASTITSMTVLAGSNASVTLANHTLTTGQIVYISGVTPTTYNGTWNVLSTPTASMFTIGNTTGSAWTSGGSVGYAPQMSIAASSNVAGLILKSIAADTGAATNMIEVWGSTNNSTLFSVNRFGQAQIAGLSSTSVLGANNTNGYTVIRALNSNASAAVFVGRGVSTQQADLLQIQNSSTSAIFAVNSIGQLLINYPNGTQFSASPAMISASTLNATTKGILVQGSASQTANLQEFQNSASTVKFAIQSDYPSSSATGASSSYGVWMYLGNTALAPSSNPSGGGYMYVDSGSLKYRGPSGTVTTLAVP